MSRPLCLLPLDDRPVNLDDVQRLAQVAGETLLTPPTALLGRFLQPGDPAALADWLAATLPTARAGIISLDMLAYGGLVASRMPVASPEEALRHFAVLRELKRRHPALHLFAFNVIMRLSITGADAETRAAGRDIFRYSVLRYQAETLGDAAAATELAKVEARIPPRLLQAYLAARARNHTVNLAALDLLADGVVDYLTLVQEDTAPAGLHLAEQHALAAHAQRRGVTAGYDLYPGTDEAGQALLARYLLHESGYTIPVATCYRDPDAAAWPALFEDRPLRETVGYHLAVVGGQPTAGGVTLAVNTFTPPQPDLFEMPPLPAPTWADALRTFSPNGAETWAPALPAPLAVADVAYCNGGDPWLLHGLCASGRYAELDAYAGWNTAGNTLGTTLAHAAVRALARHRGLSPTLEEAHRRVLLVRLLDDGLYQSIVRAWVAAQVEESGGSPLNLGNGAAAIEAQVDAALQALWRELRAQYPALAALDRPFRAVLPWGRLFEVRIIDTGIA